MSTSRSRAALANIPNATNSPHRSLAATTAKRPRPQGGLHQQENEPPQKKQMLEKDVANLANSTTPRRRILESSVEGRVFERGPNNVQPTAFQRKLVAARDKGATLKVTKNNERPAAHDNTENIRQWQKHYRKVFPSFSFYFESIPEDVRAKFVRQIAALGAQEEKFFSKNVTHIVTTRPIPADNEPPSPDTASIISPTTNDDNDGDNPPRTINPTLLEKASAVGRGHPVASQVQAGLAIKEGTGNIDVLSRGRQMGMKIWTCEKFQRILASMLEDRVQGQVTRGHITALSNARHKEEGLSQVLRNERLNGRTDREQTTLSKELVIFKGPFIYIHDMDEKTRPTMVREYLKVGHRSEGAWPQFRSATAGKCPFVEDPATRKEMERDREERRAIALQQARGAVQAPRAGPTTAVAEAKMEPPLRRSPRKALQEVQNVQAPSAMANPALAAASKAMATTKVERQPSFPTPTLEKKDSAGFARPLHHMHFAREPAASGIQQSNLTSAIRSQMISSTAAGPGARGGTSKEVNELKRKVLERTNTGSLSVGSMPSSHRMTDIAGALKNARAPAPQRAAKSKAQERLGGIQEEYNPSDDDRAAERAANAPPSRKKTAKKDPKPGYCENCRDKYDDFEGHIVSRKHRKFAMTQSNWVELDQLLRKLQPPDT